MPIVVGKSVNFLLTKFTPKAGQIYPQGVNLTPVDTPVLEPMRLIFSSCRLVFTMQSAMPLHCKHQPATAKNHLLQLILLTGLQ